MLRDAALHTAVRDRAAALGLTVTTAVERALRAWLRAGGPALVDFAAPEPLRGRPRRDKSRS